MNNTAQFFVTVLTESWAGQPSLKPKASYFAGASRVRASRAPIPSTHLLQERHAHVSFGTYLVRLPGAILHCATVLTFLVTLYPFLGPDACAARPAQQLYDALQLVPMIPSIMVGVDLEDSCGGDEMQSKHRVLYRRSQRDPRQLLASRIPR